MPVIRHSRISGHYNNNNNLISIIVQIIIFVIVVKHCANEQGETVVGMASKTRGKRSAAASSSVVVEEPVTKVQRVAEEKQETGKPRVRDLFETLPYGPAPESPAVANAWLEDHGRSLGHFIGNKWVRPEGRATYDSYNPATGEKLASTVQG